MENKYQEQYQPPPPGFAPPPPYTAGPSPQPPPEMQSPPGVIYIQQNVFGPDTQRLTCPHCQASISTRVESESSTKTHLFALLLCIVGCWPCVPCPYCMDTCLVKKHYCPSCNQYLGQYDN